MELTNVKMSMNPFCEIAVEVFDMLLMPSTRAVYSAAPQLINTVDQQEALRLKEQKVAKEVVVVSVGPKSSQVQQQLYS